MIETNGRNELEIAIDGGTSTGKSSTSERVAKRLGLVHIDTGLVYRTLAWTVAFHRLNPDDATDCLRLAEDLATEFEFIDGETVRAGVVVLKSEHLRTAKVTDWSSRVAVHAEARQVLLDLQRRAAADGAVVEGRDIGTVVLPDADLKIFLTVSEAERLRRSTKSGGAALAQINSERDRRETTRQTAPLVAVPEALTLDTSNLTVIEVADLIVDRALALRWPKVGATQT